MAFHVWFACLDLTVHLLYCLRDILHSLHFGSCLVDPGLCGFCAEGLFLQVHTKMEVDTIRLFLYYEAHKLTDGQTDFPSSHCDKRTIKHCYYYVNKHGKLTLNKSKGNMGIKLKQKPNKCEYTTKSLKYLGLVSVLVRRWQSLCKAAEKKKSSVWVWTNQYIYIKNVSSLFVRALSFLNLEWQIIPWQEETGSCPAAASLCQISSSNTVTGRWSET